MKDDDDDNYDDDDDDGGGGDSDDNDDNDNVLLVHINQSIFRYNSTGSHSFFFNNSTWNISRFCLTRLPI